MAKRHRKQILIIEDEPDIQNFISRALELEGYHAIRAYDGETGLDVLESNIVDLVLLDLRLPGIDGWAILHEIRNSPVISAIPVVIITAIAGAEERHKCMQMGATRHLVKPLSARSVLGAVAAVFRHKPVGYVPTKAYSVSQA